MKIIFTKGGGRVILLGITFFLLFISFGGEREKRDADTSSSSRESVFVSRVIDGDTIDLEDGRRVRYIGIDTPEFSHTSNEQDECFARESWEKNRSLVEGKEIHIERDISETDTYGRLLRYVYVGDVLVQEVLLHEGYARILNIPPDVSNAETFHALEEDAHKNQRGLWGEDCL